MSILKSSLAVAFSFFVLNPLSFSASAQSIQREFSRQSQIAVDGSTITATYDRSSTSASLEGSTLSAVNIQIDVISKKLKNPAGARIILIERCGNTRGKLEQVFQCDTSPGIPTADGLMRYTTLFPYGCHPMGDTFNLARVMPFGKALLINSTSRYDQLHCDQEIAVTINGQWLKNSYNESNFRFEF